MRSVVRIAVIGAAVFVCSVHAVGDGLDACLQNSKSRARSSCLNRWVRQTPVDTILSALEARTASNPQQVLDLLPLVSRSREDAVAAPPVAASLLDLEGRSLSTLDRTAEAAEAFRAAIALDDGATRMTWLASENGWTTPVAPGNGRLERAVRSFIAAGRVDDAGDVAQRALALGAGEWARRALEELAVPAPARPRPWTAPAWYPRMPDVPIRLFDGDRMRTSDAAGKVLILEFWATWCAPCRDELPLLQAMYDRHHEAGLEIVAINANETAEIALPYARELGLTLPIAENSPAIDAAFAAKSLPTVILIDRTGRIRARWNGYKPGVEVELAERTRQLLTGENEEPPVEFARVLEGDGALDVQWLRDLRKRIEGLAVIEASSRILVSVGDFVLDAGPDGKVTRQWSSTLAAGRLLPGPADANGDYDLIGFRPGGTTLVDFDPAADYLVRFDAPAAVFDAAWFPDAEGAPALVVATRDGLYETSVTGAARKLLDGMTAAVAVSGQGAERRLLALDGAGTVHHLGATLEVADRQPVPAEAWHLAADPEETDAFGVLPPSVRRVVTGRFLGDGSSQAALITAEDQLIVLDLAAGQIRFRAHWPRIADLAVGDLDGDGVDELVVAAGKLLAVLSGTGPGDP